MRIRRLPPSCPRSRRAQISYNWEPAHAPVLYRGSAGDPDSHDALNPSIVRRGSAYYNFYSGFDGKTWRTLLATSSDGLAWKKEGVVLSPDPAAGEGDYIAANGTAVFENGGFWYWYQAGQKDTPRIGLARSRDGRNWRKARFPVLDYGPRGSWDERGLGDPYAIKVGGDFYLFYLGQDRARRQQLGVARSTDGEHWQKLRTNPVLSFGKYRKLRRDGTRRTRCVDRPRILLDALRRPRCRREKTPRPGPVHRRRSIGRSCLRSSKAIRPGTVR